MRHEVMKWKKWKKKKKREGEKWQEVLIDDRPKAKQKVS